VLDRFLEGQDAPVGWVLADAEGVVDFDDGAGELKERRWSPFAYGAMEPTIGRLFGEVGAGEVAKKLGPFASFAGGFDHRAFGKGASDGDFVGGKGFGWWYSQRRWTTAKHARSVIMILGDVPRFWVETALFDLGTRFVAGVFATRPDKDDYVYLQAPFLGKLECCIHLSRPFALAGLPAVFGCRDFAVISTLEMTARVLLRLRVPEADDDEPPHGVEKCPIVAEFRVGCGMLTVEVSPRADVDPDFADEVVNAETLGGEWQGTHCGLREKITFQSCSATGITARRGWRSRAKDGEAGLSAEVGKRDRL